MAIKTIKSKDITEEENRMNMEALANYKGITITSKFISCDVDGNDIYNIQVFAYDTIQDLILNVTNLVSKILAYSGYGVEYDNINNSIRGYNTDSVYYESALEKQGYKVKSYRI